MKEEGRRTRDEKEIRREKRVEHDFNDSGINRIKTLKTALRFFGRKQPFVLLHPVFLLYSKEIL